MSIKDTLRPTYHKLKAALRPAQRRRHAKRQFQLDYERFEKASILATGPEDREQWIGVLTIDYHRIEKGLALPDMRAGFGCKVIMRLVKNCELYVARFGPDRYTEIVASCIQAYVDRHREMGREFPELEAFLATSPSTQDQGGVKTVSGKDIRAAAMIDADGFFGSRHSIRDFGPQPVSEETLSHAVSLARNAPSVCN